MPQSGQQRVYDVGIYCTLSTVCTPEWRIRVDSATVGAPGFETRNTVEECLDYCNRDLKCFGIDVDILVSPKQCWKHDDPSRFTEDNIYPQPGTNSYQLITRCPMTTETTGL